MMPPIATLLLLPAYSLVVEKTDAKAEIGPTLLAIGVGVGLWCILFLVGILRSAPSIALEDEHEKDQIQETITAERDKCLQELANLHGASIHRLARLLNVIERCLILHNSIPDDGARLLSDWKPKYEQLKVDALSAMPNAGYRTRLRTKIRAYERQEDAEMNGWQAEPWRRVVWAVRNALQEIYDELSD